MWGRNDSHVTHNFQIDKCGPNVPELGIIMGVETTTQQNTAKKKSVVNNTALILTWRTTTLYQAETKMSART